MDAPEGRFRVLPKKESVIQSNLVSDWWPREVWWTLRPAISQPVVRFGSKGIEDGQFLGAWAVACNMKGEIIVADLGNHRIQVFDKDGQFLFKFGCEGGADGQLRSPGAVAIDYRNNNQIVVADANNQRVQVFDGRGGFLRSFSIDVREWYPCGVVVDQTDGNYFVTDGEYVRRLTNVFSGGFSDPHCIGLLSTGNVVVGEFQGQRIQIIDSSGYHSVRKFGENVTPNGIFIDADDNILVTDPPHGLILVFDVNGNCVKKIGGLGSGICMDLHGRIISCFGDEILIL